MAMDEKQRRKVSLMLWGFMFLLICSMYVGKCNEGRRELSVDEGKWSKLLLVLDQIEKNYVDTISYEILTGVSGRVKRIYTKE